MNRPRNVLWTVMIMSAFQCGSVARGEYISQMSRFAQRDPLGYKESLLPYLRGSILNVLDPSGLSSCYRWNPRTLRLEPCAVGGIPAIPADRPPTSTSRPAPARPQIPTTKPTAPDIPRILDGPYNPYDVFHFYGNCCGAADHCEVFNINDPGYEQTHTPIPGNCVDSACAHHDQCIATIPGGDWNNAGGMPCNCLFVSELAQCQSAGLPPNAADAAERMIAFFCHVLEVAEYPCPGSPCTSL
jgi:hypothetical protein